MTNIFTQSNRGNVTCPSKKAKRKVPDFLHSQMSVFLRKNSWISTIFLIDSGWSARDFILDTSINFDYIYVGGHRQSFMDFILTEVAMYAKDAVHVYVRYACCKLISIIETRIEHFGLSFVFLNARLKNEAQITNRQITIQVPLR